MRLLRSWLADYVDLSGLSNAELSEIVTTRVAEVDSLEELVGDLIIEIDNKSLTHRPDLWSHFGFARELSAVLSRKLKPVALAGGPEDLLKEFSGSGYPVEVKAETECRRFLSLVIDGVSPGVTPAWIKSRLEAVGAGTKNLLVDLSNYVMLDTGSPNHVFDLDKLSGSLTVRNAREGEKLVALDGVTYELLPQDVVVDSGGTPVSLAGIIGGQDSAVSDSTRRILFEAACWNPVRVRRTATRLGVRTDAALRFEKNQSPHLPPLALSRFVEILSGEQPGISVSGAVFDCFIDRPAETVIETSYSYIAERLGPGAPNQAKMTETLTALGLRLSGSGDVFSAVVPYYRATRDLSHADDLVEEIGRCHGYENLRETPATFASKPSPLPLLSELENECRELLRGAGFSEVLNYSFVDPEYGITLGFSMDNAVFMRNPMDSSQGAMRPSLIPGMVEAMRRNQRFGDEIALFEIGRSYSTTEEPRFTEYKTLERPANLAAFEKRMLCLALSAREQSPGELFFALLNQLKKLLSLRTGCALEASRPAESIPWMHLHRSALVSAAGKELGVIAECAPSLKLDERVVIAEIELDTLLELSQRRSYKVTSRFPSSLFEVSIVCPERTEYRELERVLRSGAPRELIRELELLTVYQGKPLAVGQKSVSIRMHLGAEDRTLPGDELSAIQEQVMHQIESSGFTLRR